MYGDCQVMSTMGGGNVVTNSESLFSSPIHNPNFNFMPTMPFQPFSSSMKEEDGILRGKEEIMDQSGSGSEQVEDKSGNEQEINNEQQQQQAAKKKRYHRHTVRQIQEMEALFKECPHPDDKQRMKLSHDLGLKPRQVKFWFQNRRTQMKAQQDRSDNVILRAENEGLKNENYRLQAALRNIICPNCGGPCIMGPDLGLDDHQLRIENARLREELERVCCITSRYTGRSLQTMAPPSSLMPPSLDLDMNIYPTRHFVDQISPCTEMIPVPMLPPESSHFQEGGLLLMEDEKSVAMELAASSMTELVKMCQMNEPLWIRNGENEREVLNFDEHARLFQWPLNIKQRSELRTEATRDNAVVIMNSVTLVDAFLDAQKWMDLFPTIVARARTVQIIASGASGHASGTLQLMHAEFQVLSPLVSTRETHFLRYCQQNAEEGTWAVVDFPVDSFHQNFHQNFHHSYPKYCRRSSGCVIQDMPNGYSRVTWVEHAKVIEKPVHQIFSNYVYSGMAFGAQRWLGVLQRQCERVASQMARNISDLGVIPSPEARKNLMKLANRMIKTFSLNMTTCGGQSWTAISDSPEDTVRITTRKITEPGQPNGVILAAVSTTWLPYSHTKVFDLLRDERHRSQMDALSNGNSLNEVAHIANGSHPGNCISLLRINVASNSSQNVELMLQESCTDQSGSLVVYTTIDIDSIQLAMSGEDPSCIALLPQGFMIVPMVSSNTDTSSLGGNSSDQGTPSSTTTNAAAANSGCLLIMGMQVLASTIPSAKLNLSSVTAINNHLCNTLHQIESALCSTTNNNCFVGSCSEPTTSAPPK